MDFILGGSGNFPDAVVYVCRINAKYWDVN